MSLFEDLIAELKEENLIEETVIEISKAESSVFSYNPPDLKKTSAENILPPNENLNSTKKTSENPPVLLQNSSPENFLNKQPQNQPSKNSFELVAQEKAMPDKNVPKAEAASNNSEDFFRRRATEEVSSLKIVEHILSGVEREQMKISAKSYDDIPVNLALHDFLKITGDPHSPEHSIAEFKLMGETESWHSALLRRDKLISVGDLRRYCESKRPPLSSQALAALSRFYRNSPFSTAVRNKFDLILSRFVTKELIDHRREMVFDRQELIRHLSDLYADWSSVPLYAADDDPEVLIATLKFEEFIKEAQAAESFEALIEKDFFNRLRIFKDSIGENFFSPLLTAIAIECNVIVGNRYVELIEAERVKNNSDVLEEKYNFLLDQPVSEATSKTLELIELLKHKQEKIEENSEKKFESEKKQVSEISKIPETKAELSAEIPEESPKSGRQKFLLIVLLAIVLIGGLYFFVNYFAPAPFVEPTTEKVNAVESAFGEYFKTARINEDTYFAVALPAWNDLTQEKKQDILWKILTEGQKKDYKNVHIMNNDGKTVGLASADRGVELFDF